MFKNIISAVAALFIAIFVVSLFVKLMGVTLQILMNLAFLGLIVFLSLPLYIIIKKKFFKK